MGRILGLMCLALIGLSLASRNQILDEFVPTALNASPQIIITLSSYSPVPTSDWSTGFWVYLDQGIQRVVQMFDPFMGIYWFDTTEGIQFDGYQQPSITTPTTLVQKWVHLLIGSSTSWGYFVATYRESSGNFHQMLPSLTLTTASTIHLLMGDCGGFSPVIIN